MAICSSAAARSPRRTARRLLFAAHRRSGGDGVVDRGWCATANARRSISSLPRVTRSLRRANRGPVPWRKVCARGRQRRRPRLTGIAVRSGHAGESGNCRIAVALAENLGSERSISSCFRDMSSSVDAGRENCWTHAEQERLSSHASGSILAFVHRRRLSLPPLRLRARPATGVQGSAVGSLRRQSNSAPTLVFVGEVGEELGGRLSGLAPRSRWHPFASCSPDMRSGARRAESLDLAAAQEASSRRASGVLAGRLSVRVHANSGRSGPI